MGKKYSFRDVIEALRIVAPFCIAARYKDGLGHCIEASVSGATALRRKGIVAQAAICAVVAFRTDLNVGGSIGLSARQIYEQQCKTPGPKLPSFEEWKDTIAKSLPRDEHPVHAVIEARHNGDRAIIDLTLGQLRSTGDFARDIPLDLVMYFKKGWPTVEVTPWVIYYMDSMHERSALEAVKAKMAEYSNAGFVEDICDSMKLALALELDVDSILMQLQRLNPEVFKETLQRLQAAGFGH